MLYIVASFYLKNETGFFDAAWCKWAVKNGVFSFFLGILAPIFDVGYFPSLQKSTLRQV